MAFWPGDVWSVESGAKPSAGPKAPTAPPREPMFGLSRVVANEFCMPATVMGAPELDCPEACAAAPGKDPADKPKIPCRLPSFELPDAPLTALTNEAKPGGNELGLNKGCEKIATTL